MLFSEFLNHDCCAFWISTRLGSFPITVVSAITSPRRCPESSLNSKYNSSSTRGKSKIVQKIIPHGGIMAKTSGIDSGRLRINDCFVEHGLPSTSDITEKPIKRFPTDWPPYNESEIAR